MFNWKVDLTQKNLFIRTSDFDLKDKILPFTFLNARYLLLEIEQFIFTPH
jgi:uncharacterized protein YjbK